MRKTPRARHEPATPLSERTYYCAVDGKPFTPLRWNQKTCSPECATKMRQQRDRRDRAKKDPVKHTERYCVNDDCRKPFRPRNSNHITCSPECGEARKNRLAHQRREERRVITDQPDYLPVPTIPMDRTETDELIAEMHKRGFYVLKADMTNQEQRFDLDIEMFDGDTFKVAFLGDTHYCSKQQQHTHLTHFYHYAHDVEGVTDFFHGGDLFNGDGKQHRGQEFENFIHGEDEQLDYVESQYPQIKGCTTRVIGGSHDYSFFKSSGSDILRRLADRRDDIEYLGYSGAYINFTPEVDVYEHHPDGGTAYALSYNTQKKIENFTPENKPRIYCAHHYHRALYMPAYRNVEALMVPCFQAQTPFLKAKAIFPVIGAWIVEFTVNEDGLARFKPELFRYYVPVEKDY